MNGKHQPSNDYSNVIADLSYHDYAIFIAHMDNEPYYYDLFGLGQPESHFLRGHDSVKRHFDKFREDLVKYSQAFDQLKSYEEIETAPADKMKPYLYRTSSFVSFGNTDTLSIVAVDSFDFIYKFAYKHDLPLKQTTFAFCPKLDARLGVKELEFSTQHPDRVSSPFFDMSDIYSENSLRDRHSDSKNDFFARRPLICLTYLKLNSMAVLGPGLLFQQSLYKLIVMKIRLYLAEMRESYRFNNGANDIITADDVDNFKCMLLDPQGWCDIAIIMLCSNYSVMTSVLMELRSITFQDIYDLTPEVLSALKHHNIHCHVDKLISDSIHQEANPDKPLGKNHIFNATSSTIGIHHESFIPASPMQRIVLNNSRGYVFGDTHYTIYPGHDEAAKRLIKDNTDQDYNYAKNEPTFISDPKWEPYVWVTIGMHDINETAHLNSDAFVNRCLPIGTFINRIFRKQSRQKSCGIQDVTTQVYIPTLPANNKYASDSVKYDIGFRSLLATMGLKLFSDEKSPYSTARIWDALLKLRIPAPMSRWLLYSYSDFVQSMMDPFLLVDVIDLCDIFETVFMIFTKYLPQKHSERDNNGEHNLFEHMTEREVAELHELFRCISSALMNRTQLGFRDVERWQKANDMKGGLNQLVSAAEAPLLCGLGILRRVFSRELKDENMKDWRNRVGAVSEFGYNARAMSRKINLGQEDQFILLAMDLNATHLARPGFLVKYFHEVAHLMWDIIFIWHPSAVYESNNPNRMIVIGELESKLTNVNGESGKNQLIERYEEIFTEMFVFKFIFECDKESYYRDYITQYFLDPISYCNKSSDTLNRLKEVLIRGFLAMGPVSGSKSEIERIFLEVIVDGGRYHPEFYRQMQSDAIKAEVINAFKSVYQESIVLCDALWTEINNLYKFLNDDQVYGTNPINHESLEVFIRKGYKEKRPIILSQIGEKALKSNYSKRDELDHCKLPVIYLVRTLLRIQLEALYKDVEIADPNKAVCLTRDIASGRPAAEVLPSRLVIDHKKGTIMEKRYSGWNPMVLDRNYSGFFTTNLKTRQEWFGKRIMLTKNFWDVSSILRADRFRHLLQKTWPERFIEI